MGQKLNENLIHYGKTNICMHLHLKLNNLGNILNHPHYLYTFRIVMSLKSL
jgi:hypothetical protein